MRKIIIVLSVFFSAHAYSQDTLSSREFNNFSYRLPEGIKPTDSVSVDKALRLIAPKMFKDAELFTQKPLRDSGVLKDVYYTLVYGALYQNNYGEALSYIEKARKLLYKKKYTAPSFLFEKAYALTKMNSDLTTSEGKYKSSFLNDFKLMDPAFVKDEANKLKSSYSLQTVTKNNKEIESYLNESLQSDSMVVMYNMPYLMELFLKANVIAQKNVQLAEILNALSPENVTMLNVKIPMRDGIKLGGMLFRNAAEKQKVPAIISQSPYPSGNEALHGNIFAVNGYAFLYVDCRGRRASEGEFFPYENDSHDFYDIIDWASKQPWCNGKVATTGGSYLGFTQWQAIRKENRHPALKAINPMAAVGFGVDFPRNFQSFYTYTLRWAEYVKGSTLNSALFDNENFWLKKEYQLYKNHIPFSKFDSVAGVKNPFFSKWVSHPDFDNYWQNILPKKEDYRSLDIPVLTTTGYIDADQGGALYYYQNHIKYNEHAKHYMIIGPYDHGSTQWLPGASQGGEIIDEEAQIPLYKYVIQWFDWALKGKPLPAFFKDKVNYYIPGNHVWKFAPTLNAATNDSLKFYLSETSLLGKYPKWKMQKTISPTDSSFSYDHDIYSVQDSLLIFAPNMIRDKDSAYYAFNPGISFETASMEKDIIITGKCTAHLFASLNVPDADLTVIYEIIDSTGNEIFIAYEDMRTRYRNSGEYPELMIPGKPALLNFNSAFFKVKKIKKGEKIRVIISVKNNLFAEKNYGAGGVVSKETITGSHIIQTRVFTGKKYPSYIAIPVQ